MPCLWTTDKPEHNEYLAMREDEVNALRAEVQRVKGLNDTLLVALDAAQKVIQSLRRQYEEEEYEPEKRSN